MLARRLHSPLAQRLASYPAVALIGPRQCGKTTLAKAFGGRYFDLEQEADRLRLDLSWDSLMIGEDLLILDEAQTWPALFPRLRGAIDQQRQRHGRFLLLGSVSPSLMREVSESLAGRLGLMELTPLLLSELGDPEALMSRWFFGGYPDGGILTPAAYPRWQRDYLTLLAQRDLPLWGLPAQPAVTDRLLRLLAALHGQLWNASQVGQSLGLSYHTVNSYLDYLEGAFLIRRLLPYHANLRKRLVKTPKVYWRDSGLLHSLLHVATADALLDQPWVGASWEGFVIEQILSELDALGWTGTAYHCRTSDQYEVDLLLVTGQELWAIEIKLSSDPKLADLQRLEKLADLLGAERRTLISQTSQPWGEGRRASCNLPSFIAQLRTTFG